MHHQKDEIAAEHQRGLPQPFRALLQLGLRLRRRRLRRRRLRRRPLRRRPLRRRHRLFLALLPLLLLLAELNPLAKFDERLNQEE